jgi:hypothetical protein
MNIVPLVSVLFIAIIAMNLPNRARRLRRAKVIHVRF